MTGRVKQCGSTRQAARLGQPHRPPRRLQEHGEGTLLPPAPANTQPELTPLPNPAEDPPSTPAAGLQTPSAKPRGHDSAAQTRHQPLLPPQVMLAPIRTVAPFIPLLLVALGAWACCPRSSTAAPASNERGKSFFPGTTRCPGLLTPFVSSTGSTRRVKPHACPCAAFAPGMPP